MQCLWRISVFTQHEYATTEILFSSRSSSNLNLTKMKSPLWPIFAVQKFIIRKKVFVSIICSKCTHSNRGEKKGIATLLLHCNVVVNRRCSYYLRLHLKSINIQSKQWASQNSKRIECTHSMQKVRLLESAAVFGTNWWHSLSPR